MAGSLRPVHESGFALPDRGIHLFVGGSELHGAKVYGTDDLDIYGVYIEPPAAVSRLLTAAYRKAREIWELGVVRRLADSSP